MDYEIITDKIVKFIQEKNNGLNGAVIGLSGGIDSAVVAYLAVKALGKNNLYGLIMPYNVTENTGDGIELAETLGINYEVINIKPLVETFEKTNHFDKTSVKGNLMARVRMCLLYGIANEKKLFVLGTTNKSEFEVGYFTKHGDGGVDIEPIADLYKTEVWELARYLGISEKIINKKPSAELWANQTDEEELGISYFTLDKVLKGEINDKKLVDKVNELKKNAQHKKSMPPKAVLR